MCTTGERERQDEAAASATVASPVIASLPVLDKGSPGAAAVHLAAYLTALQRLWQPVAWSNMCGLGCSLEMRGQDSAPRYLLREGEETHDRLPCPLPSPLRPEDRRL